MQWSLVSTYIRFHRTTIACSFLSYYMCNSILSLKGFEYFEKEICCSELRDQTISQASSQIQGQSVSWKRFLPFFPTQLTAPGSPRMEVKCCFQEVKDSEKWKLSPPPPKGDYSLLQEVPTINLWLRIFWLYKEVVTYESWLLTRRSSPMFQLHPDA